MFCYIASKTSCLVKKKLRQKNYKIDGKTY